MSKRTATQIFSIFGDCEAAAAEVLIREGVANRIDAREIPADVKVNELGQVARFAVVVPASALARFERMIADLRA